MTQHPILFDELEEELGDLFQPRREAEATHLKSLNLTQATIQKVELLQVIHPDGSNEPTGLSS